MSDTFFEPVEALEEFVDEMFPPKEGGLVDRHRKRIAAQKATADEAENADEPIQEKSYKAIKVAIEQPETLAAQSILIAPGASAPILPAYAYRKRALISVFDATTPAAVAHVLLAKDQGGVVTMPAAGTYLPGNVFHLWNGQILAVESRAQLWAGNPGADPVIVSVLPEFYGPQAK